MAFADLELPYIPFHFPWVATEASRAFLLRALVGLCFRYSWFPAGFAERQRGYSETLRFDGSRCGDAELSVVAVQQP